MHITGKIFAALVVLAGLGATIMTAKLVTVRNSWTAKTQSFENNFKTATVDAQSVRQQHLLVQAELERLNRDWGTDFRSVGGVPTQILGAADGRLEVGLGSNVGLKEKQIIHGFEVQADNTTIYRGPFEVLAGLQAERCAAAPKWRIRPGEPATWQAGRWRWRSAVPAGYSKRFDDQGLNFTRSDETLADRSASLAIQGRLLDETKAALQRRTAELVGGPELPQEESLPQEFRLGLVATLEAGEEERNTVLLEIDDLRRQVREARDAMQRIHEENIKLTAQLPQASGTAANVSQNR